MRRRRAIGRPATMQSVQCDEEEAGHRRGRLGIGAGWVMIRLDWRRCFGYLPGLADGSIALQTRHRRLVRIAVLVAITSLASAGVSGMPAGADDKVPLGGGAG